MKRIGIYAGKNLLRIILLLFAVSILTFALVSASPIDPLQANVGQAALGSMSEEQKEKLRSYWGVDEPPVQRYLNWLNAFIGRWRNFSVIPAAGDKGHCSEAGKFSFSYGTGVGGFRTCGLPSGSTCRGVSGQAAG